ncbi:hypothetical protein [Glycomyces tenuis]|uniref:hypothetical protein n=1 Tax=Glycomyces tenuis TaxID=58116 RepID=UPI00047E6B87|nr:hypothetical protein [Glycomyces tenuis]
MPYDWQPGDRCKVRPIFELPASTRSTWRIRSRYTYPGTVKALHHLPTRTLVIVDLDDHEELSIEGQHLQTASLFSLHAEACRCRRCRMAPHNRQAEAWPTRARRSALAALHGAKRGAIWCLRCIWAPGPSAPTRGK